MSPPFNPSEETQRNRSPGLSEACEAFGVELEFWDIWGNLHPAPDHVLKTILAALGVDVSSPERLAASARDRQQQQWTRALAATIVASQTHPEFDIAVPRSGETAPIRIDLHFEDGSRRTWQTSLEDALTTGQAGEFVRKKVLLPEGLPLGYHQLIVTPAGRPEARARLILAPDRAYSAEWLRDNKAAGLAVSLYGVRSARNWGCGDTTDLRQLAEWAALELGVDFIALNPLHAIANRAPYNTSPYLPNSTFYRNHIYLDIEAIEDFGPLAAVPPPSLPHRLLASSSVQQEISAVRDAPFVEYERVSRLKLRFLKLLFRRFLRDEFRNRTERALALDAYIAREGDLLHQFAVHSALDEAQHKADPRVWNWRAWPAAYQNPASPETREFARSHWRSVLLHKYIQWQLDLQFEAAHQHARQQGLRIGLYHDLALATDRFGCDLWAAGEFYANGCRVGSPPDGFSPKGQDWGFPPPNAERHFEDGYQLFAQSIRKASRHGGALRIDHVMRFFRLYWIPEGSDATEGTYVRDRYLELIRVLALESVRGQFLVVGEDLGTVPDLLREALREFGILSYRLFYFEKDRNQRYLRPDQYPRQALVSATTHDLPTLAGFWQNADIEARYAAGVLGGEPAYRQTLEDRMAEKQKILDLLRDLQFLPHWFPPDVRAVPHLTGELHNAIIGFLATTPSQLLLVNQEDLFKDAHQQNLPGTTSEHPNWRHKVVFTLEELRAGAADGHTRMLRGWLERSGRSRTT